MLQKASLPIFNDGRTAVQGRNNNVSFDPEKWATDYNYIRVIQGESGICTFAAALASAADCGIDLGKRITYRGGNYYNVQLYSDASVTSKSGLAGHHVFFDGTVYPQDLQPSFHIETIGGQDVQILDNYWALLFARAYLQDKATVRWETAPSSDAEWYRGWMGVTWGGRSPWQAPKNASFALAGGDKNNWDTSEGMRAIEHLEQNLAKRSICTVTTEDTGYGATATEGHMWAVLGLSYDGSNGGEDVKKLHQLLKGLAPPDWLKRYKVRLYNPWGEVPRELTWPDFAKSFKTIVMVTQHGIRH